VFSQKNRGLAGKKCSFRKRFFTFSWIFLSQLLGGQELAGIASLRKKSCLKTYRRFFVLCPMCLNNTMIRSNKLNSPRQARGGRAACGAAYAHPSLDL
jgi:hypothetical protein